ncbi:MAG TPA: phosphopantetheine-binding protein, partial [Ktedonobacteraceae bacterium]
AGRQILVLDPAGQICPPGVVGEIFIRSPYLTAGYVQRPEATRQSFIQSPLHQSFHDPVYRTGDLGRWLLTDTLEFLGRRDQQLKIRGMRVELEEIEAVILRYDGIAACAVEARPGETGEPRLVAYLVLSRRDAPERAELPVALRRFLGTYLPQHMLPAFFVIIEALPRTASGKVERRALPAPDWEQHFLQEGFVGPRTPLETQLSEIWTQVLGRERVGIHDNFFQIGGHSLLATQLIARIRHELQRELALPAFFEAPTIAELTQLLEHTQAEPEASISIAHSIGGEQIFVSAFDQLSEEEITSLLQHILNESSGN